MAILTIEQVSKYYEQKKVLDNVSFSVEQGEILVIIGASGSGKSTLLRCINQLEKIDEGNINIKGQEMIVGTKKGKVVYQKKAILEEMNLKCGMVFQNFNLFPHLSIIENITKAPMKVLKQDKKEAEKRAEELLEKMGIAEKRDQYPCQLSGGQQQRVSIARALAIKPEILFMDEPTSALDPELIGEVLKVIEELAKEKRTMVIVTHEIRLAEEIADKVIFMDQGKIVEEGTPEQVIRQSKEKRTKEFLRRYQR